MTERECAELLNLRTRVLTQRDEIKRLQGKINALESDAALLADAIPVEFIETAARGAEKKEDVIPLFALLISWKEYQQRYPEQFKNYAGGREQCD